MESFTQDTVASVVIGSQRYGGIKAPYFKPKIRAKINMWPNDLSISLIFKVGMEKPIEGSDKYEAFEENIRVMFSHSNGGLWEFTVQPGTGKEAEASWRWEVMEDSVPKVNRLHRDDPGAQLLSAIRATDRMRLHLASFPNGRMEAFLVETRKDVTETGLGNYRDALSWERTMLPVRENMTPFPPAIKYKSLTDWAIVYAAGIRREHAMELKTLFGGGQLKCLLRFETIRHQHKWGWWIHVRMQHITGQEMSSYRPPTGSLLRVLPRGLSENMGMVIGRRTKADFVLECTRTSDWRQVVTDDFECPGDLEPIQQGITASRQHKIVCGIKEHGQVPSGFPLVQVLLGRESLPVGKPRTFTGDQDQALKGCYDNLASSHQPAYECCLRRSKGPLMLLKGPPGTGKTSLLAKIAWSFVRTGHRVLLCAPSNAAADELFARTMAHLSVSLAKGSPDYMGIRFQSLAKERHFLADISEDEWDQNPSGDGKLDSRKWGLASRTLQLVKDFAKGTNTFGDPKIFPAMRWLKLRDQLIGTGTLSVDDRRFYYDSEKAYTEEVLARAWIMGSTLNNSIMMRDLNWVPSICIIDEAAQALEPDTVIPLAIFQPYLRVVILAGDDSQLRPTVLSNAKTNEFIHSTSMSLMERLINSQVHPVILLGENFRCRPEITDLVSKNFYEGKLQSHKSRYYPSRCYIAFMDVAEQMEWPDAWGPSNMFFVDVVDGISRRDAAFSRYNFANVTVIMRMLADLLTHTDNILAQDVTILTPYKAQVIRLERMIQGAMEISPEWGPLLQGVTVSTIDNYQGRDNEIVFLDLVLAGGNERKAGFMSDKHRLNVALSRAKDVLIVVGNKAKLKRIGGLKSTAEDAQRLLSVIEDVGPTYVAEAGKCPDCNESLHPGSYCHGTGNLLG